MVELLNWIEARATHGSETTVRDLFRHLNSASSGRSRAAALIIDDLVNSGAIRVVKTPTGGRPKELVLLSKVLQTASETDVTVMPKAPSGEPALLSLNQNPESHSLRLLGSFTIYNLSATFKRGDFVTDKFVCERLIEMGAPVAKLNEPNKLQCLSPKCFHIWDAVPVDLSASAVVWKSDARMLMRHNGIPVAYSIERKSGEVDTEPVIVSKVKSQPWLPLRIPAPDECVICPSCRTAFLRSSLLADYADLPQAAHC